MQCLITLKDMDEEDGGFRAGFIKLADGRVLKTDAGFLLPDHSIQEHKMPFDWLDPRLRVLVCHCAAVNQDERPDLRSAWNCVNATINSEQFQWSELGENPEDRFLQGLLDHPFQIDET